MTTDKPNLAREVIHWEGAPLICDHSGRAIESAYGDNLEN